MTHDKDQAGASCRRPDEARAALARGRPTPRSFESAELFAGNDEVLIQHRGREYRLRITQNGKLILNA